MNEKTLEDWQKRVVEERDELDGKRERLMAFFGTQQFRGLPPADQSRLNRQLEAMRHYSNILEERIEAF